jgi:hypothetical protein
MITNLFIAAMVTGTMPTVTVRVEGDGFLRFAKNSQLVYCRQAKLTATAQGLMASDGSILIPRLVAPAGTQKVEVSMDGTITAQVANGRKQMGRLVIAIFDPKTAFVKVGNYVSTSARPTLTNPGEWVAGVIRTNSLTPTTTEPTPIIANSGKAPKTAAANFFEPKAEVNLNVKSEIDTEKSDKILLGSIAKISGDPAIVEALIRVDFGRVPLFGSRRGMTLINVRANIAAAGIDVRKLTINVPEGATVESMSQVVTVASIDEAVNQAFKAKFGFETKVEQKYKVNAVSVPIGALTIDVSQLNLNNTDISGVVDIAVKGKITNSLKVNYSLPSLSMVKRGDVVRLRLVSNFAKVEVNAKATTIGYLGQSGTVQTDNGSVHTGILIGPSLVEVKL